MNSAYAVPLSSDTVRIERTLPGPIDRVWAYLVDSDLRARWLASGVIEPRVGGSVEHVWRNNALTENDAPAPQKYAHIADEARMQGRVTEFDPPRALAYTWGEDASASSEVRYELTPQGNRVRLVLTHRRLSPDQMTSVAAGWHTHLDILVARLEDRAHEGFWREHTRLEREYVARLAH
ncbi:putative activator of Hsp90 ATPase homologue 1-like protein [Lysobacter dokdonensis DS-58]|uniref:Putative activator of Hsp90 ATPase homologue 1-like protein n=1 Tax=Lysobacter dokdonensis DS-58 TaxID=1300345 RepID=A0A0A2X5P6_9GAMM|nr:SRPBCC family protein [Lysobacter dokdonensis]KGQ20564.1 putative activator of Hsp90 ATPase homologue 1-like protein [Lysobacter dokdonensis DS-58]